MDHALGTAQFLGLSENESRYFLLLVERSRAASSKLKDFISKQILEARRDGQNLKKVLTQERELSDSEKAVFHSNWTYSAVRLLTSVSGFQSADAIAAKLGLNPAQVRQIVDYLLEHGLILREGATLKLGPQRTHLEKSSPYIVSRQKTWRVKAFECMDRRRDDDLFYTGPMAVSKAAVENLRHEITLMLKRLTDQAVREKPENIFCLNIDLFQVAKD